MDWVRIFTLIAFVSRLVSGAYRRTLTTTRLWQPFMGDPVQSAKAIGTALTTRWPRARYLVGYDAQALALWSSLTPTELKDHIVRLVMSL